MKAHEWNTVIAILHPWQSPWRPHDAIRGRIHHAVRADTHVSDFSIGTRLWRYINPWEKPRHTHIAGAWAPRCFCCA